MNKKIAIFISSLVGGGVQRSMVKLARGFLQHEYQVDVVLASAHGPFLKELHPNVNIVDLKGSRALFVWPRLATYLRNHKPNVLLSAQTHINIVALWASRLSNSGTGIIVSERNFLTLSAKGSPLLGDRMRPVLTRMFYPWARAITAVSNAVADDLSARSRIPREQIEVIYNPIVTPELFEWAKEEVDHPWVSRPEGAILLGVGRLVPQKDFGTLIKAVGFLREKREIRLVILGEGEERAKLESLIEKLGLEAHIDLPGFAPNPYAYMRRADLFILSSAWEGLPGVLIEAMACGTAVVSTDCPGGSREILENGKFGRLVPVGDPEAMAAAIEATLDDPPDSEVLEARAKVFSVEAATARYVKLIEEVSQ